MPSDTQLKKRRTTHYDLGRHFELFLEATSLNAMTTKKNIPAPEGNQASVVQSVDAPYKHTNRDTANHNYIYSDNVFRLSFFQKAEKSHPTPYPVPDRAV
jgi:hypothetical protein